MSSINDVKEFKVNWKICNPTWRPISSRGMIDRVHECMVTDSRKYNIDRSRNKWGFHLCIDVLYR